MPVILSFLCTPAKGWLLEHHCPWSEKYWQHLQRCVWLHGCRWGCFCLMMRKVLFELTSSISLCESLDCLASGKSETCSWLPCLSVYFGLSTLVAVPSSGQWPAMRVVTFEINKRFILIITITATGTPGPENTAAPFALKTSRRKLKKQWNYIQIPGTHSTTSSHFKPKPHNTINIARHALTIVTSEAAYLWRHASNNFVVFTGWYDFFLNNTDVGYLPRCSPMAIAN